jgi:WD40 repeat protein
MRHDATDLEPSRGEDAEVPKRSRSGRTRVSLLNRAIAGLLLLGVIVLVWLYHRNPASDIVPMRLVRGESGGLTLGFAFSPDGTMIATTHDDGRAAIRDVKDGWSLGRFLDYHGYTHDPTFSPGGRYLALAGGETDILVFDLPSGGARRPLNTPVR